MSRSRKIFLVFAAVFFILLFYASYDISRRTTFPGSKGQLRQRIQDTYIKKSDSLSADSLTKK